MKAFVDEIHQDITVYGDARYTVNITLNCDSEKIEQFHIIDLAKPIYIPDLSISNILEKHEHELIDILKEKYPEEFI